MLKNVVKTVVILCILLLTACRAAETDDDPKLSVTESQFVEPTTETEATEPFDKVSDMEETKILDKYLDGEIPEFTTEIGILEGHYSCGAGNNAVYYTGVTKDEYLSYRVVLETEGYLRHAENTVGGNMFTTYVKSETDTAVYVSYVTKDAACKIVYGSIGYLPQSIEPEYVSVTTPSVTQIGRKGAKSSAPGLSMVVQLADGSYVLIDGGPLETIDQQGLLNFLVENNTEESKPRVKWMFTHAHSDHVTLAIAFLQRYYEEIELEMVAYNFPDFEVYVASEEVEGTKNCAVYETMLLNAVDKYYEDVEIYTFHAGEKLFLPGCEIEFLLTHEDFWPNEMPWINHTSSAWKMTIEDKAMLILGDCEKTMCQWMADAYGEEMKSDILQLTHHGFNGACMDLYQYVDPDICFWPVDQDRYENDERCVGIQSGYEFNVWIRDDTIKVREHYTASETVTLYYPDLIKNEIITKSE